MALVEDMFKGNFATGLAIGAGALLFGPTLGSDNWQHRAAGSQGGD